MSLITGISDRTLLRLFQDRFHVSPKAYLNRLRLNGTHQELRRADTMKGRISDIANRWGFWHMGQFAADYRDSPIGNQRKKQVLIISTSSGYLRFSARIQIHIIYKEIPARIPATTWMLPSSPGLSPSPRIT